MSVGSPFDVAVIGAGVVGCGVARALTLQGFKVVVLERDDAVAAGWASGGNTGIACTAADCTPGTLEHALLTEAVTLNVPTYKRLNVPHLCGGALYVAWTQADADGPLRDLWKAHGGGSGSKAKWLEGAEAIAAVACGGGAPESGVCEGAVAAVHVLGEVTVDPWLVPVAWITQAEVNGAEVRLGTSVEAATYSDGLWHLSTATNGAELSPAEEEVVAAAVVNCGGLWADSVDALTDSSEGPTAAGTTATAATATLEVAPRRGDYLIYGAIDEGGSSPVGVVPLGGVPLPSGGRGPYLWRTVHGDLVCGPTNEPVLRPNPLTSATSSSSTYQDGTLQGGVATALPPASEQQQAQLKAHGERVYGKLASARVRDSYVGLRPALREVATSHSSTASGATTAATGDYVVRFDTAAGAASADDIAPEAPRRLAWLTCAGARSTGLTASLVLGEFVAQLLAAPNIAAAATASSSSSSSSITTPGATTLATEGVLAAAIASAASAHPPIAWPSCAQSGTEHAKWALPTPLVEAQWPQLPSLETLAHSFAERNDGCVEIRCSKAPTTGSSQGEGEKEQDGGNTSATTIYPPVVRRVTHPQTRYGLATRPPYRALTRTNYPALSSLLETLTPESPLSFLKEATEASVLRGGYTNALYLVRVPTTSSSSSLFSTWVVRKSGASSSADEKEGGKDPLFGVHRICRDAEHVAVGAAASKGIAPTALFDPTASLLAQEYICEPVTFAAADVLSSLHDCVDLLKALHENVPASDFKRPRDTHVFDVFETAQHYLSVVRGQSKDNTVNTDGSWAAALPSDIDALFVAASRLASALAVRGPAVHGPETANSAATNAEANQGSSNMCRWPLAACHNDLVVGNWVRGSLRGEPRKLYLIDFEYSAPGDRCFDLANLCVNADLDEAATCRVIRRYLSGSAASSKSEEASEEEFKELYARVELLKVLSDLREGLWALAHGTTVASPLLPASLAKGMQEAAPPPPLPPPSLSSSSTDKEEAEEEPPAEEGRLPASFYVAYGLRHLERFRKSLQDPALERYVSEVAA